MGTVTLAGRGGLRRAAAVVASPGVPAVVLLTRADHARSLWQGVAFDRRLHFT